MAAYGNKRTEKPLVPPCFQCGASCLSSIGHPWMRIWWRLRSSNHWCWFRASSQQRAHLQTPPSNHPVWATKQTSYRLGNKPFKGAFHAQQSLQKEVFYPFPIHSICLKNKSWKWGSSPTICLIFFQIFPVLGMLVLGMMLLCCSIFESVIVRPLRHQLKKRHRIITRFIVLENEEVYIPTTPITTTMKPRWVVSEEEING